MQPLLWLLHVKILACMPAGTSTAGAAAARRTSSRRRVSFAATCPSHNGADDIPHQQQFEIGASVWDNTHHTCRGYGVICAAGNPADDGTPKWYVEWDNKQEGQRCRAIQETSLQLSLIQHDKRKPPTALGQSIIVLVGTHKGKTGTTVRKVGKPFGVAMIAGVL